MTLPFQATECYLASVAPIDGTLRSMSKIFETHMNV